MKMNVGRVFLYDRFSLIHKNARGQNRFVKIDMEIINKLYH